LKLPKDKLVFTEEDCTWSAHDPAVPGVHGLGPTRKAAKADWREVKALADKYDAVRSDRAKTVRERPNAGLAATGYPENRLDITTAHAKLLLKRYPKLFQEAWTCPTRGSCPFARDGFACADGWFDIVDRLARRLAAHPNLRVRQLKEHYGLLTIRLYGQATLPAKIKTAMDAAREESRVTCELCGIPGTRKERDLQLSVRCPACAAEDDAREASADAEDLRLAKHTLREIRAGRSIPIPMEARREHRASDEGRADHRDHQRAYHALERDRRVGEHGSEKLTTPRGVRKAVAEILP
jgi:hypothetical protein